MASTGGVKLGSTYDEARTRKVNAEAEIAELELKKIKGELVAAEDVVSAWGSVLGVLRTRLTSLPNKAAPLMAAESQAGVCQSILEDLIAEALEELSNYDPEINAASVAEATLEASDTDAKAATKANSKRVGRPKKTARLSK